MKTKKEMRLKRKLSIRRRLSGTALRPRLAVFRSNMRLTVQLVDDDRAKTILSAWTKGKNSKAATELGKKIAEMAKAKKITKVVFDRSGYRYHGAVKAIADAVREGGLEV
ncbi:MAG: 50S ribosomal protein L18 [Patescibacteria group bacterium]